MKGSYIMHQAKAIPQGAVGILHLILERSRGIVEHIPLVLWRRVSGPLIDDQDWLAWGEMFYGNIFMGCSINR